jgi:biopolymer transport protein ExbB
MIEAFWQFMQRGGVVMWPLLGLSVIALALVVERVWFFVWVNHPGRLQRMGALSRLLRAGEHERAKHLADRDSSVYGRVVLRLLEATRPTEAAGQEAIELERRRLERFMPTLSTIITAAPMLGILGTVLGLIDSFELLSDAASGATSNPRSVSGAIAVALLTTAAGLTISVAALFPYNAFRAQVDRTLSRLEALTAAAVHGASSDADGPSQQGGQQQATAAPAEAGRDG